MKRAVEFALVLACSGPAFSEEPKTEPGKPTEPRASVVVIGKTPEQNRTIDGATYDVRDNAQSAAGSAADVLNTIPSVTVTPDGAVTVRGDANVQVYIDGKPSARTRGENLATTLQSMPGGAIASIDVITNPSAKFDSNGGAIVNLTLKKARGEGLHATAVVAGGDHGRATASVNTTYGDEKHSASLSLSLRDDVRYTEIQSDRRLFGDDGAMTARFITDTHYTPTHARSANVDGAITRTLGPESEVGIDFGYSGGSPYNTVYEHHTDFDGNGGVVSEYDRVREGFYFNDNGNVSLHFERRGSPTTASVKLIAQHGGGKLRSDRLFTATYAAPARPTTSERVILFSDSTFDRVAADLEREVVTDLRLSVGAEWKRDVNRFRNERQDLLMGDDAVPSFSSVFEGEERTTAAYVTAAKRSGPWTVQAGARYESRDVTSKVSTGAADTARRLSHLNTSAAVSRSLAGDDGNNQIVLRYADTAQRIDPRDLNPATVFVTAQDWSVGNPDLAPQRVERIEMEYDWRRGEASGAVTGYYRRTTDTITEIVTYRDDNVAITAKANGGASEAIGVEATVSAALTSKLKAGATANLFRARLADAGFRGQNAARAQTSYALQANLQWTATAKDRVNLDGAAQGPSLIAQGERSGTYALNAVWRRTLSPRLTLALTARGVLLDNRVRTRITTERAIVDTNRESGGRAGIVSLTYKLS